MEYVGGLLINIAANLIFWLALGLVFRYFVVGKTNARFLKFFGLENSRKLTVYLSNLWLPTMPKKSGGCIISGDEFKATKTINSLFGSAPYRLADLARGLVDSFWIGKKIEVDIQVSPMDSTYDLKDNMIVVGAATKNSIRRYYVHHNMVSVIIAGESPDPIEDVHVNPLKQHFIVKKGKESGTLPGPENCNLAIIEKVYDEDHGRVVFMCVGLRGDTSWAATEYLKRHWNDLFKVFGNKNFACCLWFLDTDSPLNKDREPHDIKSFPSSILTPQESLSQSATN